MDTSQLSSYDPDAILQRHESGDQGTFGEFFVRGLGRLCYTGELPWRGNAPSISCLPPGAVRTQLTYSPRFGRPLYLLAPTDPRTGIRIHPANLAGDALKGWHSQLNGCIALGERLGWIDGQKAVLVSVSAVRRVEQYFGGRPFLLEIRDPERG